MISTDFKKKYLTYVMKTNFSCHVYNYNKQYCSPQLKVVLYWVEGDEACFIIVYYKFLANSWLIFAFDWPNFPKNAYTSLSIGFYFFLSCFCLCWYFHCLLKDKGSLWLLPLRGTKGRKREFLVPFYLWCSRNWILCPIIRLLKNRRDSWKCRKKII